MALTSTMHTFRLDISDVDRGVYETLEIRVARHPSETVRFMVVRVLAFALEHRDGLAFGRGVSTADEPALWVVDPTGRPTLWIDVGAPAPERLHKASKRVGAVAVYTSRDVAAYAEKLAGAVIHRAEDIRLVGLPEAMVLGLADTVARRNDWGVVRTDGALFVTTGGGETFEGAISLFHAAGR